MVDLTRKPTIPEVMPLVVEYYSMPGNLAGGSLHIVLDDQNVGDDSVDFCIQWARDRDDTEGVRLGEMLRRMSRTQRAKIAATKWAAIQASTKGIG